MKTWDVGKDGGRWVVILDKLKLLSQDPIVMPGVSSSRQR